MQVMGKKANYRQLKSNDKIWNEVFKYSNHENMKFIDPRDMIIHTGNYSFAIISAKSEYQKSFQTKKKNNTYESDVKLYDSLAILFSPIVIFNYTRFPFSLKVNRQFKLTLKSN